MDNLRFTQLLDRLVTSTRSPRGRYSAQSTWPLLQQRLRAFNRRRRYILWLRTTGVAACLVLALLGGWMAWQTWGDARMQTVATLAEVRTLHLPDGSEVTLNRYSTLTYPKRFKGGKRQVTLEGEARFDVTKDTLHPFIVQAEAVCVQVLGTHFNVEAYKADKQVKTTLLEGRVAVSAEGAEQRLVLSPGENAVFDKRTLRLTQHASPHASDEVLWTHGILYFQQESLQEIARQLTNAYHREVRIDDDSLRRYRVTATFRTDEGLADILGLLQEATGFNFRTEGDAYVITPSTASTKP